MSLRNGLTKSASNEPPPQSRETGKAPTKVPSNILDKRLTIHTSGGQASETIGIWQRTLFYDQVRVP